VKINPVKFVPALVDGDLVVSDSFAIILVSSNSSPHLLSILINSDNVSAVIY
jgi:glutathione S-transferase